MSDAYGTLVFAESDDCKFNAVELAKVLNAYAWDNEGGAWECEIGDGSQYDSLNFNSSKPQYPSVFPRKTLIYICYSTVRKSAYTRTEEEMTDEDWDRVVRSYDVEISMAELVDKIRPCLQSGWIEIAYASNEKHRYVEFGSLHISKEGQCHQRLIRSGPGTDPVDISETL